MSPSLKRGDCPQDEGAAGRRGLVGGGGLTTMLWAPCWVTCPRPHRAEMWRLLSARLSSAHHLPVCPADGRQRPRAGLPPPPSRVSPLTFLFLRKGFYWNETAVFPDPPWDGMDPNKTVPVTLSNVQHYADTLSYNVRRRAPWFLTRYMLWPG